MNVGQRIKDRRKQLGISAEALAEMIGKSPATVYRYEKGEIKNVDSTVLLPIADALGVTPSYLMGWDDEPPADRPLPPRLRPISSLHRQKVPLIGRVAAGEPIMAEQDLETWVESPVDCDAALEVEVEGESMKPTYLPGDILYIKCVPDVPEGQVAVVLIDDEATIKHVYRRPQGLTLISDNPDFAPILIEAADHEYLRIYGVPVGYTRLYKKDALKKIKKGFGK